MLFWQKRGGHGFKVMRCFLICLLFIIVSPLKGEEDCSRLLASSFQGSEQLDANQKFFAYVGGLMDEGVLGYDELGAFSRSLNEGRLANPVTQEVGQRNYRAQVHQSSLQEYVDSGELDIERVRFWVLERLKKVEHNRERRYIVHDETREILIEDVFSKVKIVRLPGGRFTMGSPKTEKGRSGNEEQVEAEISPFEMMDAPVTQEVWVEMMGVNPSRFEGWEHPVEMVPWSDLQEFLKKLNRQLGWTGKKGYRLPTEAEWEYAARAGTKTAYFFGDDPGDLEEYAVIGAEYTSPVRSKKSNPWGLYDMYGNVWELMVDKYAEKLKGGKNPLQENGRYQVIRGGGWYSGEKCSRSASRHCMWSVIYVSSGFRVVRGL